MTASTKVHPAADIFPLMAEVELAALAEDIKTNGLRQPIVLTGDGDLLDGRNRLAACKLANVEPEYVTANGDDPLAVVVSLNVKRRNLSAGQKAVAAAEAWDMGPKSRSRSKVLGEIFGVSHAYVDQARALLERDPPAAEAVKNGDLTLAEAHEALRKREGKTKGAAGEKRRLRESHPDLAEQVDAEVLGLEEALEEAKTRAAAEKLVRWTTTSNVLDGLEFFDAPADPDLVQRTVANLDPDIAAQSGREITPARLRRAAAYAEALAHQMEVNP